ncbi:MAG: FAD-binding oxidoreductase [Anaeromyxobacter sp.]|nr:FAD-binding oxidoreductase [Anaeromyxobacter sp.]
MVGGGFFGCRIAQHLRLQGQEVLIVEQGPDLLLRASYNNQARVHQGYHYPRSLLTAIRSRANFARFIEEYPECVVDSFEKYYAVARQFSHVTAKQFRDFCRRIGAPIEPAPLRVQRLFDHGRIEEVFLVKEFAFDAVKLRDRVRRDLEAAAVKIWLDTRAVRVVEATGQRLGVELQGPGGAGRVEARRVLNCTYSGINHLLGSSRLPIIPLKHEGTEMALVEPPEELSNAGVTVMCGPFFSIMPFPPRGLHTLSHVRYTPHHWWHDQARAEARPEGHRPELRSAYQHMLRDVVRYMPCLARSTYRGSLWEVKTVLPASEQDDSRPILFKVDHGIRGLTCVMGGKIDNVYDVITELNVLHEAGGLP